MHEKITEAPTRSEIDLNLHPDDPKHRPTKKRSSARVIGILLVVALVAGGFFIYRSTHKTPTTAAAGRGRGGRNVGDPNASVPVAVTAALRHDLPVYLDGLGSVEAFNTVTVKSRVDGEMMQVNFKEGQEVHKGDLLATIDPRPFQVALAQAQANLAKDQAQLADAKAIADRDAQLLKDGIIPQQQYDTQVALTNQIQAATQGDQAQIDNAKLNIDYAHITAPIDGRVGLRLVDPGNIIHSSDPNGLLVITQMEPIAVIFTLPEDALQMVNGRMRSGATLPVKAFSRDNGSQIASGTLLTIDNQIDQTTGTFRLKAVFDNKDRALWPNQFVNARLLIDTKRNAIIIPSAAVQRGDEGSFVYRINPSDNTAEVVPVTVGVTQDNISQIESGLAVNDLVVTDGQDRLRAGARVDPRPDTRSNGPANGSAGTPPRVPDPPAGASGSARPQFRPPATSPFGGSNSQPNAQSGNSQGFRQGNGNRRSRQQ
ncbi:MAG TPA: MdtA/MuxA family multidrug efflux RND transporter periplasmic adaptor subunit [Candidatus Acidoferrales bacterium]|jgi:multidrug efflux system membrane fusion protein|nr:MdtA/MuxA family multidrug efflux RND transporter periplasmic adaptor subunit [Candidatus Acidoferrales bacterium]